MQLASNPFYVVRVGDAVSLAPVVTGAPAGTNTLAAPTRVWLSPESYDRSIRPVDLGLTYNPNGATGQISGTAEHPGVYRFRWRGVVFYAEADVGTPPAGTPDYAAQHPYIYPEDGWTANGVDVFPQGQSVRLYPKILDLPAPWVGLEEGTQYTVERTIPYPPYPELGTNAFRLRKSGALVTHAYSVTSWNCLIGAADAVVNSPWSYLIVVDPDAELPLPKAPGRGELRFAWDLVSGNVSATTWPAVPDYAMLPSPERVPDGLADGLVLPAKIGDSALWAVTLLRGEEPDNATPGAFRVTVWDPDGNPITVGTGAPSYDVIDGRRHYCLPVAFPAASFGELASRTNGTPAVLLDAEIRATFAGGRNKATRTFQVWLEDSRAA